MIERNHEEIEKLRAELQWKAELYALAVELIDDALAGDLFALTTLSQCGLVAMPCMDGSPGQSAD